MEKNKKAVLSLSGGMDSTSLLMHLLSKNYEVHCLSFNYGQKHKYELEKAKSLTTFLKERNFNVSHKIIDISSIQDILISSLTSSNIEIPEGSYNEKDMKSTVVPNRNKIFSSIIQACAISISDGSETFISLGVHAGDHDVYPDTTLDFIEDDFKAFNTGNWNTDNIHLYMPYIKLDKGQVLKDGVKSCEKLGLDYKEVYINSFTSYNPISIDGKTYSDYKTASSIERIAAFKSNNLIDPIPYADQDGLKDWEFVKNSTSN